MKKILIVGSAGVGLAVAAAAVETLKAYGVDAESLTPEELDAAIYENAPSELPQPTFIPPLPAFQVVPLQVPQGRSPELVQLQLKAPPAGVSPTRRRYNRRAYRKNG